MERPYGFRKKILNIATCMVKQNNLPDVAAYQHPCHELELQFHKREVHEQWNIYQQVQDKLYCDHIFVSVIAQPEYPTCRKQCYEEAVLIIYYK